MKKRLLSLLICFSVIFLASAQTGNAVNGKLTNQDSQPVARAVLTVLNTNIEAVTDSAGDFHFSGLGPGKYVLRINANGYALVNKDFQVGIGNEVRLSIRLADASDQLDQVVVTAEKKEASLQEIPVSISAISARQVNQYRLWNLKDITAIVPNLYSTNSGDDRNVTTIRGIGTTSYDPAVATYIDGVNQFGLDTYIAQLLDVERIEVLRGPQGTLYGRNAMGGVINIITKQPTNTSSGFATANFGNYGLMRYELGYRTPIVKDKLYIGVAGMYSQRNGYYRNDFNDKTFDDQKNLAGNYYLKYIASPRWTATLNVKHQNNRNDGAFPMVGSMEEALDNPYRLNQNATAEMVDNTFNTSLSLVHNGGHYNFSSQTSYQSNRRFYDAPLDGDFSPADMFTIFNDYGGKWNKVKVFTQEFKFTSPTASASPLKWTAGAYFFRQDNPVKQATHVGKDTAFLGVPDAEFSTINTSTGKNTGVAIYGQGTYSITSKLDVIAGIRFDQEWKSLEVLGEYQKDPDPNPIFETRPDTSAKANFSAFSPKLGLSFRANNNTKVFLTYSRGFRTGGLTPLAQGGDPSQPPLYPFDPEYSDNLEFGFKNTFLGNRLRLNLALFASQVTDAQVPTLVLPDAVTITRNAGKLASKGAELEIAANVIKGLEIDYSFGVTEATYKDLKIAQNGGEVDLSGNTQIFTPRSTSMLAAQYTLPVKVRYPFSFVLRGEWTRLGEQYFDLANVIVQPSYNLVNARAGFTSKNFELMFWWRNIGGKKYIAYAYDFGAVHLGNPETMGITVSTRF
jgi:iron complex outermembrane receptor protein